MAKRPTHFHRRPSGLPARPQAVVDGEWQRWIAENLLLGADRAVVIGRLVERGFPLLTASAAVAEACDHPYFKAAHTLQRRLAKRDWHLAAQAKLERLRDSDEVERRPNLDPATFLRDYYAAGRPVVIDGLIDAWPARSSWSFDYIEQRLPGDTPVEVQAGRESDADYEIASNRHKAMMPLADLLPILRGDTTNDVYVTANNGGHNRDALAPLWDDLGLMPGYLAPGGDQTGFFWMGPRGTITPWHHDLTNNLLVQIVGRKRVTLVSASQTPLMRNHRHCYSQFGQKAVFDDLPAAERPRTLRCTLGPGETLFIPVGWWHHVEASDATIGMSFTGFAADNDFYSFYDCYENV